MNRVSILLLCEIIVISLCILFLQKKRMLDIPKLITLILFLIVFPISGLVHLNSETIIFRGYFDLIPYIETSLPLDTALLSIIIGFSLTLSVFLQPQVSKKPASRNIIDLKNLRIIQCFMILLVFFSLYAFKKIETYLTQKEINRVLFLEGGIARFFYITVWIVWPILIFGSQFIHLKIIKSNFKRKLIFTVAVGVILHYILNWTGSRLLPLLFFYVFIQIAKPFDRKESRFLILLTPVILSSYIYFTTINRISSLSYGKNIFKLESLLDWQIGRFSILGATLKYNSDYGLAHGSTFASTLIQAFQGFSRLIGIKISGFGSDLLSISQEYGQVIYSNTNNRYLAPGLIVEFFRNYSILGIVIFCFTLPYFLTKLYRVSISHDDFFVRMLSCYYMISLLFVAFLSSSESFVAYFIYYPLPMIAIILFQRKTIWRLSIKHESNRNDF